ncbi:HipA-like protein [Bradyrhizobium sp. GM22.5]
MNKPVLAAERIQSLDISLNDLAVGTLVRTPGDYSAFNLLPAYRSLNDPPIFSLSLRSADGSLRRDPKPIRGALPPFFANLLPEEKLREAMEKHHAASVRPGNDFDLLAALGTNLPGAVRALPSDGVPVPAGPESEGKKKARFSLAGVQMKLSVIKNTGKGGITLAVDDEQGQYIAKFPSLTHIGLSENEFAILALAEALGMEVPARELVEKTDFAGIPEELNTMSTGKVLLVRRFDRGADAARVHMEDFAQVFGRYPSEKYTGAAYHKYRGRAEQRCLVRFRDRICPSSCALRDHGQWRHASQELVVTVSWRGTEAYVGANLRRALNSFLYPERWSSIEPCGRKVIQAPDSRALAQFREPQPSSRGGSGDGCS